MSYDIYLTIHTGIDFSTVAEVGNMTSNCSPMWGKAIGYSLGELDGKRAEDCIPILEFAIGNMEREPETYAALNPSNGWGNSEAALAYLRTFLERCREHPLTVVRISR